MVRAELVAQVLRDCAACGVRVAVVVSSGFGEGMGAGEGILESVAPELAASGMRILGPNCEGLASLPADAPLTFSPVLDIDASGTQLRPGNIAVLSQSGGLGFAVAQWGTEVGPGLLLHHQHRQRVRPRLRGAGRPPRGAARHGHRDHAHRGLPRPRGVRPASASASGRRASASWWPSSARRRRAPAAPTRTPGTSLATSRTTPACSVPTMSLEADSEEELIDVVQAIAKSRRLGTAGAAAGRADRHRHHLRRRRGMARRRLRGARP